MNDTSSEQKEGGGGDECSNASCSPFCCATKSAHFVATPLILLQRSLRICCVSALQAVHSIALSAYPTLVANRLSVAASSIYISVAAAASNQFRSAPPQHRPRWRDSIVLQYCSFWKWLMFPFLWIHGKRNSYGWRLIYFLDLLAIWVLFALGEQARLANQVNDFYAHEGIKTTDDALDVEQAFALIWYVVSHEFRAFSFRKALTLIQKAALVLGIIRANHVSLRLSLFVVDACDDYFRDFSCSDISIPADEICAVGGGAGLDGGAGGDMMEEEANLTPVRRVTATSSQNRERRQAAAGAACAFFREGEPVAPLAVEARCSPELERWLAVGMPGAITIRTVPEEEEEEEAAEVVASS
eukprot:g15700.t1